MFYWPIKSLLFVMKCVFEHQDLQMSGFKLSKYEQFSPIFKYRDSQLQVGENINNFLHRF